MRSALGTFTLCDMNGRRLHVGSNIRKGDSPNVYEVVAIEPDTDEVFVSSAEHQGVLKSWMVELMWEAV